ncbi:MAG: plasmid mobilization relaxosome protein MobC [Alphaproteobacteria bacterium]|jgi:uncharacterized protein (DUF1778 family)|nr:plasmid mobilization relaxosome protein MobC [Alphaproteobacteria bacterium]
MKTRRIGIRISPTEKEILQNKAKQNDMNLSNFIIYNALLKKELTKEDRDNLKTLLIDIRKIGTNLNQLARGLNYLSLLEENKPILSSKTIEEIRESMEDIKKNQAQITTYIRKIL